MPEARHLRHVMPTPIKTMDEPEELVKLLDADAEAFYAEREALLSGMRHRYARV